MVMDINEIITRLEEVHTKLSSLQRQVDKLYSQVDTLLFDIEDARPKDDEDEYGNITKGEH
jgi:peptidoglycan hydrolase CwlO-like protein